MSQKILNKTFITREINLSTHIGNDMTSLMFEMIVTFYFIML